MHCTVTGGSGFIGSNLAFALQKSGHDVSVVDSLSSGNKNNLNGFEGEIIEADIREFDWAKVKADVIFHEAAITGVVNPRDGSNVREEDIMAVDLEASKKIFDYCKRRNIPFIYASSAATYGMAPVPTKERDAGHPTNAYGRAKWLFDKFVMEQKIQNLVVGLRYFNVFGPRERYKGKLASMIFQLMQQMNDGQRPRIFKFGEQKRDQIYVKDAIEATLLAMDARENCIVNVGSGDAITFNRMIAALNAALGTDLEPEYIGNPYASFYQTHTQADLTLAKEKLGFEPKWRFEDAVKNYVLEECGC
jgi:ADP-L-glycero-D-manno-heptose 6-epimerase